LNRDLLASEIGPPPAEAETHLVVAGDWHGNVDWVGKAIPSIDSGTQEVKTILHVGDFGIWTGVRGRKFLGAADFSCKRAGISRLLVTLVNYEDRPVDSDFNS
jgi:hypothetical protein